MKKIADLKKLCQLIRYDIVTSTTQAGSGHPTTSLSATELMTTLFFGGFLKYDLNNPHEFVNDRVIFSKGHASPLLYALYHAAGALDYKDLLNLRKIDSPLEGHPTPELKYVDVATGSLGQGLSVGVGMALGLKLLGATGVTGGRAPADAQRAIHENPEKHAREPRVFVLLGDSEFAEGQIYEALQIAGYYGLDNLIGVLDVNRLGQRGETMLGWDLKTYEKRIASFGWNTIVVDDGHDLGEISQAFNKTCQLKSVTISKKQITDYKPTMIIAKTIKGKGVSFLENKDGWHGKAIPKDMLSQVLKEIGKVDFKIRGKILKPNCQINPNNQNPKQNEKKLQVISYKLHDLVATRQAYGDALIALGQVDPRIVVLDAETSNSTYAEKFKTRFRERFFEMFIAEQNMASAALGLSKLGFVPFFSSFAAFLTRTFDQIRIAQYSKPNIKVVGSHAGTSIGYDGSSQMGLEDISMARSILESIVLYPSDAVSAFKLAIEAANCQGILYLRLTREQTPIIYSPKEQFPIGGSKVLHQSSQDKAVVVGAGITLHEGLKAYQKLLKRGVKIAVVDAYSVKPLDTKTILKQARKTGHVVVIEDHYPYGGLGEAVKDAMSGEKVRITHLAVRTLPHSGSPEELLRLEEIDAEAIIKAVLKQ